MATKLRVKGLELKVNSAVNHRRARSKVEAGKKKRFYRRGTEDAERTRANAGWDRKKEDAK